MPKRIYVGGFAAVDVVLADGSIVSVKNGESIEVPVEQAKLLDASGDWSSTSKPANSGKE